MCKKIVAFLFTLFVATQAGALQTQNYPLSRTSYGEGAEEIQMASDQQGNVYSVWKDDRSSQGIYFNVSHDFGNTWQEIDRAVTVEGTEYSGSLKARCDANGNVYFGWIATDSVEGTVAVLAHSADRGETWVTSYVTGQPWVDFDFAADSQGNICVVSNEGGSFPKNIFASCSHDYGHTWQTESSYVNTYIPPDPGDTVQREVTITNDENGHFYVAWVDNRNQVYGGETGIFFNVSNDYGETWETDQEIGSTGFAYFSDSPTLACTADGKVSATWKIFDGQDHLDHVAFNASSDYGASWGISRKRVSDAKAPQVAMDEDGRVFLAWVDSSDTYKKVWVQFTEDLGANWSAVTQVSLSHDVEEGHYHLLATNARVAVVWENNEPWQGIYLNYSTDHGVTWLAEDIRVDNNTGDASTDLPQLSGTSFGDLYVIWSDARAGSFNPYFNYEKLNQQAKVFQDFELFNGSDEYGWGIGAEAQLSDVQVHSGENAWQMVSTQSMGGTAVESRDEQWHMDFAPDDNNQLKFWIWADPSNQEDNTVGVKFFDHNEYVYNPAENKDGALVWTTFQAKANEWTPLTISFDQLPGDFDLNDVDKLEFYQYWDGTYYIDDVHVTSQDIVYNQFEHCTSDHLDACGWPWEGTVGIDTETVYQGNQSWKFTSNTDAFWSVAAFAFQGRTRIGEEESQWHVNFHPAQNDRLSFWIYSESDTGLDSSVGVQFFDFNDAGTEDKEPVAVWVKSPIARYGKWSRIQVAFEDVLAEFDRTLDKHPGNTQFDLNNINKVQVQFYWPGTYYIDDIRIVRPAAEFKPETLKDVRIAWNAVEGTDVYHVQASSAGPNGPWTTVYQGPETQFEYKRLNDTYLRIRTEAGGIEQRPYLYASDWSDASLATPPPILLDASELAQNRVRWTDLEDSVDVYEIQISDYRVGPWKTLYSGAYTEAIVAEPGRFYRIQGQILNDEGMVLQQSRWSPAYACNPDSGFIYADATILKFKDLFAPEVHLQGVNLGSLFVIEPWMTGLGESDSPQLEDDWSIRETLIARFGASAAQSLIEVYQDAYINEDDMNLLYDLGVNFVRIPVYYRNFLNDDGTWKDEPFARLDALIDLCADRGIYALIDLHGAPGGQNEEFHCGREDYNRLFALTDEGAAYRAQTVALWKAIALHYAGNRTVMGYDLLNEPTGFESYYSDEQEGRQVLWSFYDQLYDTIRAVDSDHVIMMEAVWDWEALPNPDDYGWENIAYQFHYYLFEYDAAGKIIGTIEDLGAHQTFIDEKVSATRIKQQEYQIPVMIGEFNAFNNAESWKYYLDTFTQENWSWTLWSLKVKDSPSQWGLLTHAFYDEDYPVLAEDSYDDLARKFSKLGTAEYHVENYSLNNLLREYLLAETPVDQPPLMTHQSEIKANEGESLSLKVYAIDPEGLGVTISASLENGDGLDTIGAQFVDNREGEATFSWVATSDYGNPVVVKLTATDASGLSIMSTLTITISGAAKMISPQPGSTLSERVVTFQWTESAGATEYHLAIGTTSEILQTKPWYDVAYRSCGLATDVTVSNLPLTGAPLYVRLWTKISGAWYYNDYTYKTLNVPPEEADIVTPVAGSTLSTRQVTFTWDTGDGDSAYAIGVGTTPKSVTKKPWGDIGYKSVGLNTSATFAAIPLTGDPIYVRLWVKTGGTWTYKDYTYATENIPMETARIGYPPEEIPLETRDVLFAWMPVEGVTRYEIGVGTTPESVASKPWGDIYYKNCGQETQVIVCGIPLNGEPLYVRLWSLIDGKWYYYDHTFQTQNIPLKAADLTSPAPQSALSTRTVTFVWSEGEGATEYGIGVGTTQASISTSPWGNLGYQGTGTKTTATFTTIPLSGEPVYVRLWSRVNGVWTYTDYSYATENREPTIINPVPGSIISTSTVTFLWEADADVSTYGIGVGTTQSSLGVKPWGNIGYQDTGLTTSATFSNIPLTGDSIYVRLWRKIGRTWYYRDFSYATEPGADDNLLWD